MVLQGQSKARQAVSTICVEAASDIASCFTVALGEQLGKHRARSSSNWGSTELGMSLGICKYESVLQMGASSLPTLPGMIAAALEDLHANGNVFNNRLSIAWQIGQTLNPMLSYQDGLEPSTAQ